MNTIIKAITPQETWPIRHKVMWPEEPFDYIKLPEDTEGLHFGLWVDDMLISVVSLFIKKEIGQFRKFATLVDKQGKGYGSQLLHHLIEIAKTKKVKKIWCNARVTKAAYYTKFDMEITNCRFSKNGIDYVVMERNFQKKYYL